MTPTQHKKTAEMFIEASHAYPPHSERRRAALAEAQVHATLALYRAPAKATKKETT